MGCFRQLTRVHIPSPVMAPVRTGVMVGGAKFIAIFSPKVMAGGGSCPAGQSGEVILRELLQKRSRQSGFQTRSKPNPVKCASFAVAS